jgi:hypothetical protein
MCDGTKDGLGSDAVDMLERKRGGVVWVWGPSWSCLRAWGVLGGTLGRVLLSWWLGLVEEVGEGRFCWVWRGEWSAKVSERISWL